MKCARCGIRIYKPCFYAHWHEDKPYHGACYRIETRPELLDNIKKYQERLRKAQVEIPGSMEVDDDDDTET